MIGWIILWASLFCPAESWHDVVRRSQSLSGTWDVTDTAGSGSVLAGVSYSLLLKLRLQERFWMKWRVMTEVELLTNTVRHISEGFAPSPSVSFLHQQEVSSSLVCVEKRSGHCDEKDLLVHIKVSTESPCYMWKRQNVNTREKSLMAPIIFSFFSHSSQRES